ncbi:hypothetical protein [Paenibacillus humicola]|uniref:hypothetical protein n=1 Tax=Paenibacillus humicola TaxID=3110540 RepID=UPI00237B86DA|nr:hypothetical protein [Paenibacillus humicola]
MNDTLSKRNASVAVVRDPADSLASREPAAWAARQLIDALERRFLQVSAVGSIGEAPAGADACIVIAGPESEPARLLLERMAAGVPAGPEAFCLAAEAGDDYTLAVAAGADIRGLVYAVLELVDRVEHAEDPLAELRGIGRIAERPATPVRGINRIFASEAEDKPWFYDKVFWDRYLTELAAQRFNRFHLAFGMGYDYGHDPDVRDNYFCFAYPFLFDVPGYEVKVAELPEAEQKRNLEMLTYISEAARSRGLHFQLGLWNHAYVYTDSPNMNYTIEGISPDNHASYCRDAIRLLLEACPAIDGITFRVHYEGGIPEPTHAFWKVALEGVALAGRQVEIDLHPKGVDDELLRLARDTGMPVTLSPKYWAEHMGLPYHQAEIREREKPDLTSPRKGLMAITATSRRFTRYGYADYLKENREYGVLHRVWPGTQRVLLWGDPAIAAGFGRLGTFCGSAGVEFCEPLSFKARKGSGSSGGRDPYADEALKLNGQEWEKYRYTYRLWGRLLYNPDADPESWKRYLRSEFGAAAASCEAALSNASRILPLVTSAHGLSGANNIYWPEMYFNHPIVLRDEATPYKDTAPPGTFGSVSPFDPALFYRIDEFAADLLNGKRCGKYSPLTVAGWLEGFAAEAERQLADAASLAADARGPVYRRWTVDIAALAGIGRFFAGKLRAGLAYKLYEQTDDPGMLEQALGFYRAARTGWKRVVEVTKDVYRDDITFGYVPYMRGSWAGRLQALEADVEAMAAEYDRVRGSETPAATKAPVAASLLLADDRPHPAFRHYSPAVFRPGETVALTAALTGEGRADRIRLHYRRANQEEHFRVAEMTRVEDQFTAEIPGEYTDSPYPLVYFFELFDGSSGHAWIMPRFAEQLSNQPYYVLRQDHSAK